MARPDQWTSHYNMGNYYLNRGELKQAVASYDKALKLEPRTVMAMVNSSLAYAGMGENDKADKSLRKALKIAPYNAAANFNLGLLKAEQKDLKSAEKYLKEALKYDPRWHRQRITSASCSLKIGLMRQSDSAGRQVKYVRMIRSMHIPLPFSWIGRAKQTKQ